MKRDKLVNKMDQEVMMTKDMEVNLRAMAWVKRWLWRRRRSMTRRRRRRLRKEG